jgi:hypothetical protein
MGLGDKEDKYQARYYQDGSADVIEVQWHKKQYTIKKFGKGKFVII